MVQEKFINPYNFIALPSKKAEAYSDTDVHTGVISYTITTKTPLFIPNTSNDNAFDCKGNHKSYDFFSYQELENGVDYKDKYFEPVIPGSEIRGMVRSLYETLTDSCMSVFNDGLYPERRTGDVFLPGLIVRENGRNGILYKLYEANSYRIIKMFKDDGKKSKFKEGQKVYFDSTGRKMPLTAENISDKKSAQRKVGYVIKGMPFGNKKHCFIFETKKDRVKYFLEQIKNGVDYTGILSPVVLNNLKVIANAPNWETQLDKETLNNLDAIFVKVSKNRTHNNKIKYFSEQTVVKFKELTEEEIDFYVNKYKPFDKAGAYGIQEWIGAIGIENIQGDYYNVVGFPCYKFFELAKEITE